MEQSKPRAQTQKAPRPTRRHITSRRPLSWPGLQLGSLSRRTHPAWFPLSVQGVSSDALVFDQRHPVLAPRPRMEGWRDGGSLSVQVRTPCRPVSPCHLPCARTNVRSARNKFTSFSRAGTHGETKHVIETIEHFRRHVVATAHATQCSRRIEEKPGPMPIIRRFQEPQFCTLFLSRRERGTEARVSTVDHGRTGTRHTHAPDTHATPVAPPGDGRSRPLSRKDRLQGNQRALLQAQERHCPGMVMIMMMRGEYTQVTVSACLSLLVVSYDEHALAEACHATREAAGERHDQDKAASPPRAEERKASVERPQEQQQQESQQEPGCKGSELPVI